jgi:fructan beta-fructosidase
LLVGIATDGPGGGSGTQYFVGQFDGHRFVNDNPPEIVLWMDHGRDFYAAQTFSGAGEVVAVAWASNWLYARETPTSAFRGSMTLPRRLTLAPTLSGLRLRQEVPRAVAEAFDVVSSDAKPHTGTYRFKVQLAHDATSLAIRLFGEDDPQFVFSRTGPRRVQLRTFRRAAHGEGFAHDYVVELVEQQSVDLEIFVDNGLVELNVGGEIWLTNVHFPANPAGPVSCSFST